MSEGATNINDIDMVKIQPLSAEQKSALEYHSMGAEDSDTNLSTGLATTKRHIEYDSRYQIVTFYLDLAHGLAYARDFSLDRAFDLTFALARARTHDLDLTLIHNLAFTLARDLALTLARTNTRTHALALARTNAHTHALVLARTLADTLTDTLARILVHDHVHTLDHDFIISLNISRLITRSIILILEILQTPAEYLQLTLNDPQLPVDGLPPDYLATAVLPYISALIQIHHVIDEIHGRFPADIKILGIRYGSVSVDLTGGIRDTVELLLDTVVSWRRENKKKLADLTLAEKETELRKKKVEVEQARAALPREAKQAEEVTGRTAAETRKVEAEAQKVEAEARLLNEQAQKQQLDNQKMQLEIMQLTLEMITRIAPDLPEEKRLLYAMKMVDPVRLIATSPLEIVEAKMVADEKGSTAADGDSGDKPESEPTDK